MREPKGGIEPPTYALPRRVPRLDGCCHRVRPLLRIRESAETPV